MLNLLDMSEICIIQITELIRHSNYTIYLAIKSS